MEKNIVAKISIKPEFKSDFLGLTKNLINDTRKEEGNIFYDLYEDVNIPSEFLFYEKYKSQEAVDSHSKTQHFTKFISEVNKMLKKEIDITIF